MIVDHEPRLLVGRYRVGEPLGAGGMGTVVAGHDLRLDRAVAIKLLRPELARDPGLRRRFEREARSAARVVHPNAVAVYDTGEDADQDAFIVMELLSGRTLARRGRRRWPAATKFVCATWPTACSPRSAPPTPSGSCTAT